MSLNIQSLKSSSFSTVSLVGLFPDLSPSVVGGVQASGRVAWQGIQQTALANDRKVSLFCYRNSADHWKRNYARLTTVLRALAWRQPCDQFLIWHMDLLKLLPFFRRQPSRVILFLHGIESWRAPDRRTGLLLKRVDLFLCNSLHTWQTFLKYHPGLSNASHQVIHLGIDSPGAAPEHSPNARPIALMLGRLIRSEDYKGQREIIDAWPRVIERNPEAQLWIVGAGDLKPDLEKMVAGRRLTGSVFFWGAVSEAKKQDLLSQCHCLALPSRGEGFGLAYLEAMRLGRPCLVSNLDAGREVVNPPEAGLAVNPGNALEVADTVCRLLTSGLEWSEWSLRARRRYETHFTAPLFQNRLNSALFSTQ